MCQRADNAALGRARNGFTIVEVLIVVAILALAAVALVGVGRYMQAKNDAILTEKCVELLSVAVAECYDLTGHYPVDDWPSRNDDGSRIRNATSSGTPAPDEVLYLQLSILPQTRKIISKLPGKLLAAPLSGATVQLAHDLSTDTPYLRSIVDPWGNVLVYQEVAGGFPIIRSDGPDGNGNTVDDISNED